MIAQELEVSLHMAFVEARQQRHEFITVEHLLLALLDNPSAAEVLRADLEREVELRKHLILRLSRYEGAGVRLSVYLCVVPHTDTHTETHGSSFVFPATPVVITKYKEESTSVW